MRRWLADEPVTACREPLTVRARRWMRRHRTLVTSAVASISVAALVLGDSTILLGRANSAVRHQERIARENLDVSRRLVAGMLRTVVAKLPDVKGMDEVQRQVLQDALKFYSEFVLERSRDPETRHEIGRAYKEIGIIRDRLRTGRRGGIRLPGGPERTRIARRRVSRCARLPSFASRDPGQPGHLLSRHTAPFRG